MAAIAEGEKWLLLMKRERKIVAAEQKACISICRSFSPQVNALLRHVIASCKSCKDLRFTRSQRAKRYELVDHLFGCVSVDLTKYIKPMKGVNIKLA